MKSGLLHIVLIIPIVLAGYTHALSPADPALIQEARDILNYFESVYTKKTVSAQRHLNNIENIAQCCGKTVVIMEQDLSGWNKDRWSGIYRKNIQKQINDCKAHARNGGIASMCFHWPNPLTEGGRFPDSQENLTAEQFNNIVTKGTAEYKTMMDDLAKHADYLQQLADENIPLIWRPLHEIDGGWFWWTDKETPENTAKLWRIVFDYLVNERGMHNLIWVYSAGVGNPATKTVEYRKPFYPGPEYVDISGIDLYNWDYQSGEREFWNGTTTYKEQFEMMQQVTPGKMLALTECQAFPDMNKTAAGNENFAPWLWALPWYGPSNRNPCGWIQQTIPHDFVITLDELPDLHGATAVAPLTSVKPVPTAFGAPPDAFVSFSRHHAGQAHRGILQVNGRTIAGSAKTCSAPSILIRNAPASR